MIDYQPRKTRPTGLLTESILIQDAISWEELSSLYNAAHTNHENHLKTSCTYKLKKSGVTRQQQLLLKQTIACRYLKTNMMYITLTFKYRHAKLQLLPL